MSFLSQLNAPAYTTVYRVKAAHSRSRNHRNEVQQSAYLDVFIVAQYLSLKLFMTGLIRTQKALDKQHYAQVVESIQLSATSRDFLFRMIF